MDGAILTAIVAALSGGITGAVTYLIARDKNRADLVVDDRSGDRAAMRAFYDDLRAELGIERTENARLQAEVIRLQLVLAGYKDVSERAVTRLEHAPGAPHEPT